MELLIKTPNRIVTDLEVEKTIWDQNIPILLGEEFPGSYIEPTKLVGDPNTTLTSKVCEMLANETILERYMEGKVVQYRWTGNPLALLSQEDLRKLAWDLRFHPNFATISPLEDLTEEQEAFILDPLNELVRISEELGGYREFED